MIGIERFEASDDESSVIDGLKPSDRDKFKEFNQILNK